MCLLILYCFIWEYIYNFKFFKIKQIRRNVIVIPVHLVLGVDV